MNKKGFTLVELLAVIVILAIILAIAIPSITSVMSNASKNAFGADAKLVLKALNFKVLENSTFDVTSVNETNIQTLLNLSATNYKTVKVTLEGGKPKVTIVGQNKWDNLVVSGTSTNLMVDEGLVLWYNFMNKTNTDTDKATATDLSGNAHNGSLTNFAYTTISGYNSGLFFDAVDDYINIGNIGFTNMSSATISFWHKTDDTTQWLLFKGQTTGHYIMATAGTSAFYHSAIGSSSVIYVDGVASNLPKTDNQWHHYLITNISLVNWTTLELSNYSGFPFRDYLGTLKVYNESFTATEALSIYNTEKLNMGF